MKASKEGHIDTQPAVARLLLLGAAWPQLQLMRVVARAHCVRPHARWQAAPAKFAPALLSAAALRERASNNSHTFSVQELSVSNDQ